MAYHLERSPTGLYTDIVIDGFQNGIADSPYDGIGDMRNVNTTTIPGEAMANFATSEMKIPIIVNGASVTIATSGNLLTWTATGVLATGMAIQFNTVTGGIGLSTGTTYWVINVSGNNFQIANSLFHVATNTPVTITGNGSGTFSTIQMGTPQYSTVDGNSFPQLPPTYFIDSQNYAWIINTGLDRPINAIADGTVVFCGNLADFTSDNFGACGIVAYHGYLFVLRSANISYIRTSVMFSGSPAWTTTWQVTNAGGLIYQAISARNDAVYFCNGQYVGYWQENSAGSFDPSNSSTYAYSNTQLLVPFGDRVSYIADFNTDLMVGGINNYVYVWDKNSITYTSVLQIPELGIFRIVATNNNAYIFAGLRGRVFITNGASVDLFFKFPDYVTGTVQPFLYWGDAIYWRNQLVFTFGTEFYQSQGADSQGNNLASINGVWQIDLTSNALRCTNSLSYGGYSGYAPMLVPNVQSFTPGGDALIIGWNNGIPGIDISTATPYHNGEVTIDSDFIPVGQILTPYTPMQVEWKAGYPIGANGNPETVAMYYRTDLSQPFSPINSTTTSTPTISDQYTTNFQEVQWVQLRLVITPNASAPTFGRMTEFRIRSSDQNQSYIAAIQQAALG